MKNIKTKQFACPYFLLDHREENFIKIWMKTEHFPLKKMHVKMSFAKSQPYCSAHDMSRTTSLRDYDFVIAVCNI